MDATDTRPLPIRAVIFDLAGTLVDFGSLAPVRAMVELFRRNGVTLTGELARKPMGLAKRDHIRALALMPEVDAQWVGAHGRRWAETDVDRLYADFAALQTDLLREHGRLIPGVLEAALELRESGVCIGVTTGYDSRMLGVVLEAMGEQGFSFVDAAVSCSDVPQGRPAPWMLFRCMEKLRVYPPATVVAVGDTVADIMAGRNAGVWTVGVTRTGNALGLSEAEVAVLDGGELEPRLSRGRAELLGAGAHFVVESAAECAELVAGEIVASIRDCRRP